MQTQALPETLDREERRTLRALAHAVGPVTFHRLIEVFGSPDRAFGAAMDEWLQACPGIAEESLRALVAGPDRRALDAEEEACDLLGARLITYRCPDYPAPVLNIHAPPPVLYVRGCWLPEDAKALAVVGTRHPTAYGLRCAREICGPLAGMGWTLVSGLARGIDTAAHLCALESGARTLAVIGTGLDVDYPPENRALAERIADNGCVVSEFPLDTRPRPSNFPRRNRLISALAPGTLVVEAGTDSGALITAHYALEQGRDVFAVPGAIQNPAARGTIYLLREGAHVAAGADDILAVLEGLGQAAPARRFLVPRPQPPPHDQGPAAGAIAAPACQPTRGLANGGPAPRKRPPPPPDPQAPLLGLLSRRAVSLEALADKARALPGFEAGEPRTLLGPLFDLELRGKVRRLPGSLYRLR